MVFISGTRFGDANALTNSRNIQRVPCSNNSNYDMVSNAIQTNPIIVTSAGHSGTRGFIQALSTVVSVYLGNIDNHRYEWDFYRILAAQINAWILGLPEQHDHNVIPPNIFENLKIPSTKIAEIRAAAVREIVDHCETSMPPSGDSVWIFKTPRTSLCLDVWQAIFPQARFINLVRDGRDVAVSTEWSAPAGTLTRRFDLWRARVNRVWRYQAEGLPIIDFRYEDLPDPLKVKKLCDDFRIPYSRGMHDVLQMNCGKGIEAMRSYPYERLELIRYGYDPHFEHLEETLQTENLIAGDRSAPNPALRKR
jgi:Sulfotransferase family